MNRKTIALPGMNDLDIQPIQPLIDTKIFQRMRDKRQLENSASVFPCAHHTRFEHSLGTFALTRERAANWQRDGVISPENAHDLPIVGLLHDIGHGPFSHATEALTGFSHHAAGIRLLDQLDGPLSDCGSDINRIRALFTGRNPVVVGVAHRPLGTDKLDYLMRDARYTSEAVRFRVGDLLNHVYYHNERLVVDRKIMPEVVQVQSDYVYMHERVYLRRCVLIVKRFFQKIVSLEMAANPALTADRLWEMTDLDLQATLLTSSNATVRNLFARLRCRELPKMAIVLLPKEVVTTDRLDGKAIATYAVDADVLARFDSFQAPAKAARLEAAVARYANLPAESVLVIPVVTPERFIPDDVPVFDGSTHLGSLHELRPGHFQHLREVTQGYAAVRMCVLPEYRERVAEPRQAHRIFDFLMAEVASV